MTYFSSDSAAQRVFMLQSAAPECSGRPHCSREYGSDCLDAHRL